MLFSVRIINAQDTYLPRQAELRKGKPISTCAFEGDNDLETLHLGGYIENKLVGVASFMPNRPNKSSSLKSSQLRGMAVLETFQKKGMGAKILIEGERILKARGYKVLWMNARVTALGFYTNLGYLTTGTVFEIENIGPHFKMLKKL